MTEVWENIQGYGSFYQVSNYGRIKSFKRYKEGVLLDPGINSSGYLYINLYLDGIPKKYTIHRLVAITFLKNPYNKQEVNHLDGNKLNNLVTNLTWVTPQENTTHAYDTGLAKSGSKSPHYKGDILVFDEYGRQVDTLHGGKDMKDKGYHPGAVYACISGKRYSHKNRTFRRVT